MFVLPIWRAALHGIVQPPLCGGERAKEERAPIVHSHSLPQTQFRKPAYYPFNHSPLHAERIKRRYMRRPNLYRALCVVLTLTLCAAATFDHAAAEVRIEASPGGNAAAFLAFFATLRRSGERVVIDGPCLSACTLVLSTIPKSRICVTRRAILGFHAATVLDQYGARYPAEAETATRVVKETYPAPVRAWIDRHGGLTHRLILLRGRELAAIYPACR
jgi:hypothetical protein